MSGPNVVLIVLDSARADTFETHAENFRKFAGSGARFDRAIAPAGWTLPSHASMFTGLSPSEHGAVALGGGKLNDRANARTRIAALERDGMLLAPRLKAAGAATFSASANPWLGPAAGLDAGFDTTDFFGFLPVGRRRIPHTSHNRGKLDRIRAITVAMARHAAWIRSGSDKGAARVLEGLERFFSARQGPVFAFTNLIETHEPHYPPKPQRTTILKPSRVAEAANTIFQPGPVRALRVRSHNWGTRQVPPRIVERWKRAYIDEVRYVDQWLGRLVEMLERVGAADQTVVIVTSDHGENLGEGGVIGHGLSVREETARVPLAMWGPGIAPEVVAEPVRLRDLAPTIEAIILGSGPPPLLGAARGQATFEIESPNQVSAPPPRASRRALGPGAAFYDGSLKYAIDPFEGPRLVDLGTDPGEESNLLGERDPTEDQLRAHDEWTGRISRDA